MQRILGQQRAIETLTGTLRSGRFPHAWIFFGPAGVGKFTTAVELAKLLLDPDVSLDGQGPITARPDSETARRICAGTHPDLHVIRKELAVYSTDTTLRGRKLLNIPVNVLREQMIGGVVGEKYRDAPAFMTPFLGHGKVFIIDEAELLDWVSQNAMLKTLEEPPKHTYILLITNQRQRLLPTLRSRCQHAQFMPLDHEAMSAWFERAQLEIGADERDWIEQFSMGSPGLAQVAAEYGLYRWHTRLAPMLDALDHGAFDTDLGKTMADLVEQFAVAWVKNHENASKDAANKSGVGHLLSILAVHARRRLAAALDQSQDAARWTEVIDLLSNAEQQLAANVNLKLVLENLAVQWAHQAAPLRA